MAVSIFVMEGGSKNGNLVIGEGDKEREKEGRLKSYSQHNFMYISCLPYSLMLPRPRAVTCSTRESRGTLWISGVEYALKES